jgi:hypothetical protein
MIKFTRPTNLNGTELIKELKNAGINVNEPLILDGNNELCLDISESDKTKAEPIVAAHNGTVIGSEPTVGEKLASVGLSIDDLKDALGL